MKTFHKILALGVLGAGLAYAPLASADLLKVTGFTVGSHDVTLTSPGFSLGPIPAGAMSLDPPAGIIAYCIDIFQTLNFNTLYDNYTTSSLATDGGGLSALRKSEISQLFHGFYNTSLTSSTNSAAFQLALWEIVYETGPTLNVDGANSSDRGVTYASNPSTPGSVITIADSWLAGLGGFASDLDGFTTYRSANHQDLISYVGHQVPEPATWTMLLAGLGVVTFLGRRRAKA